MADPSAVRAGIGMVGIGGVAGLFFAGLGLWPRISHLAPGLGPDVEICLSVAGGLAVLSFVFYLIYFYLVVRDGEKNSANTRALYSAGYPAQASALIGSFAFGMVARVDNSPNSTFLVPGLVLGALALLAMVTAFVAHGPQDPDNGKDEDSRLAAGKVAFISFQTIFSLAAPVLLIFVFTTGGLRSEETVVYTATMVSLFGQLIAFATFYTYFEHKRDNPLWVWGAIFLDVTALGLTAVAAGHFYALGNSASQGANDPELVLWLLFSSGVVKVAQWVSSHSWSSVAKSKTE